MNENDDGHILRLQRYLARAGVDSRRHCEQIIAAGRVSVNGTVADTPGFKVDDRVDRVTLDGSPVTIAPGEVYLMLNKPLGYLTAMSDPNGKRCISELVPVTRFPGLYPVGRLDVNTTGLLLFSTDGAFGNALLHPSHEVEKRYDAVIDGSLTEEQADRLRAGVSIGDGKGRTRPAQVDVLGSVDLGARHGRGTKVSVTIHEGRHRQVRKMFRAVGHTVIALDRSAFGPLVLGDLAVGAWRMLTDAEVTAVYHASGTR